MKVSGAIATALLGLSLGALTGCATLQSPPAAGGGEAYDPALADRLGADEYGMRAYVFVLLRTGPTVVDDPGARQALFVGHFQNMERLAASGARSVPNARLGRSSPDTVVDLSG